MAIRLNEFRAQHVNNKDGTSAETSEVAPKPIMDSKSALTENLKETVLSPFCSWAESVIFNMCRLVHAMAFITV